MAQIHCLKSKQFRTSTYVVSTLQTILLRTCMTIFDPSAQCHIDKEKREGNARKENSAKLGNNEYTGPRLRQNTMVLL